MSFTNLDLEKTDMVFDLRGTFRLVDTANPR
jgi:hypothetical protein